MAVIRALLLNNNKIAVVLNAMCKLELLNTLMATWHESPDAGAAAAVNDGSGAAADE